MFYRFDQCYLLLRLGYIFRADIRLYTLIYILSVCVCTRYIIVKNKTMSEYSVWKFVVYSYNSTSFWWVVIYMLLVGLRYKWKASTKPLQINTFLIGYNLTVSFANAVCFILMVSTVFESDHMFSKRRHDNVQRAASLYWILKLIEMFDTVFMVMRHKTSQITTLHVYHHASMVLLTDYYCHLAPWPAITPPTAINAFVHVLLYLYYGLSVSGPVSNRWKRHLTELQLAQFGIGLLHATYGYLYHGFCVFSIAYGISMIGLFGNFYYRAYCLPRKSTRDKLL